jgi:hypothetical protein
MELNMHNLRSTLIVTLLINAAAFACSSDTPNNTTGSGGAKAGSGGSAGSGGTSGGSGGTSGGSGGSTGSGGTTVGSGGTSGGSGGSTGGTGGSTTGTGGTVGGTGGKPADASAGDTAPEKPARACLTALGEAPGGYDWNACCPNEAATAQDWCTHYATFCKKTPTSAPFTYPVTPDGLTPGSVPLKDMADCLARFPPLTLKSRACRSNFLCEDSSLGQATAKACDFPDLNRRKCDGL